MDKKFLLISAVLQIVSALVLIGLSIYYGITEGVASMRFFIFLGVGVAFLILPVKNIIKYVKNRKNDE